ncbi:uncharacterized protein [Euphorbia lathyris]
MRAVDVTKCWPFTAGGGGANEVQQVQALLPPITFTKFRWWSHELDKIKEQGGRLLVGISGNEAKQLEENLEIVCPVCGSFMAATVKIANNHVEACLAHAEREERREIRMQKSKSKSKSPKKRSIVEIFAVSPQIDKVDDDDGEEEEEEEVHKKKKIKNKLKKTLIATKLKMERKKNKIKKKKTKKKNNSKGLISNNKGNVCKFKPSTPMHVNAPFCNKGIVGNNSDGFSIHRNKSRLKRCTKKQLGVKESKRSVKQQKSVAPVRGILKDKRKRIPPKDSDTFNMPGSSQTMCCELQHFDKQVRFSVNDDIPDQRAKNCNSSEKLVFSKYLNRLASQAEQDSSEESDKETVAAAMYESVDAYLSSRNGTELQTNNKQLPASQNPIAMLDFLRLHQENQQLVSDKSSPNRGTIYENNLAIFAQGCHNAPNNPIDTGISRLIPTVHEACPSLHSQVCAKISMASNSRGKSSNYFENQTCGFAAGGASASTRLSTQPSSASDFIGSAKGKSSFMTHNSIKGIGEQKFSYQPYCHASPMVAPELKQGVGGLSERCIDGEFYGLPLNSQGELVRLSSGGRVDFDQHKNSTMKSSCNSFSPRSLAEFVHERHPTWQDVPKSKLNLHSMHKNHNMHLPARFGVNEFSDAGILDSHLLNSEGGSNPSSYPLDSNSNLMGISFNQCRQYDQIPNCEGVHMTHLNESLDNISLKTAAPTMRLMGKDVAVGTSVAEAQGFEGGKFWIGKAIMQGHCPITTALHHALPNLPIQHDRIVCGALERSMDMLPPSMEIERNQALLNNFHMKVQGPRSSQPYLDWKTNTALQKNGLAMDRNAYAGYQSPLSVCTPFGKLHREANLQESFIPNFQQNLVSGRRLPIDVPFLHPECSEHVSSASFPSTSDNLPPWLVDAKIQAKAASMPYGLVDVGGKYHPYATTGTDFLTTPNRPYVLSHPHSCAFQDPQMGSSLGSTLFVQPPTYPFSHGRNSNSSMITSHGNRINLGDRMKFGVDVVDNCQRIKKRPAAAISGDMLRPTKMPNLIQERLSNVIELPRNNNCGNEYEADFNWEEGIDAGCRAHRNRVL